MDRTESDAPYSGEDNALLNTALHIGHAIFKVAVVIALALVLYFGVRRAYSFGYSIFTSGTAEKAPGRDVEITILDGMSDKNVADYLYEEGLVTSSSIFFVQAKIYGYTILPGSYTLNSSMTIEEMLVLLSTVPEAEKNG